jgi:hypothetical protein
MDPYSSSAGASGRYRRSTRRRGPQIRVGPYRGCSGFPDRVGGKEHEL